MRLPRLILLAAVVLGLGALIVFWERHQPTTDEVKERADKLFPTLAQDKARSIVVHNPNGEFELAKELDRWVLRKPLADEANQGAVTSLLGTLTSLKAERTLEAAGVKLADYGLDAPALSVTVVDDAGTAHVLRLGAELPLGSQRAALTDGTSVYIVNKWVASDLEKDLAGWRSDQLAQVYASDVAALTITYSGVRVALAHTGNVWALTDPLTDLADRERAEGLVADLGSARIKEFVDAPGPLREYGLDPHSFEILVVRRGENAAPIHLKLGARRDKDGAAQIACKRGERVFWVEARAVEKATAQLADWRARKLVAVDSWDQDRLEIEAGGAKAVLERVDGQWKAGGVELDFGTVNSRLTLLSELEVKAFDQPKPSAPALGKVKATSSSKVETEVEFFPADAGEVIAVVKGRDGAFTVDEGRVRDLLADPAALVRPTPTPAPAATAPPSAAPTAGG
ncbi:MAG TPA: DUF4340 domain-containing protein [Thermoanaerobaculaceae bacterium]|nr:DUF4340 domain-containing protein [Thermoanaerobaculaceae bacterium]HRS16255.1 DUF4340 domain-containing protein [Thermoanaerobaculaceae bacterium]